MSKMLINKYVTVDGFCIIKTDTYCNSFEYVQKLVAEAKKDFPDLKEEDIKVQVFNDKDKGWQRHMGIEFKAFVKSNYELINRLPYLL